MNLLSAWVVLAPGGDELGEVVGPEDGGVTGQVVEAKHQGQESDKPSLYTSCSCCGAATQRWILHSKKVLAHIGAFPNKCTIKHPFQTTAT
jgi:hypothetical protein